MAVKENVYEKDGAEADWKCESGLWLVNFIRPATCHRNCIFPRKRDNLVTLVTLRVSSFVLRLTIAIQPTI
jgi:hypothetical protein